MSASAAATLTNIRRGFSPLFWVANTLELFERFAFYGAKAVLNFYLVHKIGLDLATAGWLAGIFSGLIYSLPVVAGVFVDRFGFRKTLLTCFALFTLGYFLIGLAGMPQSQGIIAVVGKTGYVASVLVLTAVGGSLIKPCIVGTVERTTKPDYRSLGFSIYYAIVNLGGALGPLFASQIRSDGGIEYVFIMSAATSALMILGTWAFFREPAVDAASGPQRSFGKLFQDMVLIFKNTKFILFLAIFSGFWIMFWQVFYSFPFYVDEVLHFQRFEVLETVDAWSIILLSVPLTALSLRLRPIQAMILGFVIASCSWLIIAASTTIWGAICGLFFFAVGEAIQAPRFYDYVGRLAPKEQIGTFMGFAFLPIAVGSVIAGRLGAWLVQTYMRDSMRPKAMWVVVAAIGFTSTALLFLYDRWNANQLKKTGNPVPDSRVE